MDSSPTAAVDAAVTLGGVSLSCLEMPQRSFGDKPTRANYTRPAGGAKRWDDTRLVAGNPPANLLAAQRGLR